MSIKAYGGQPIYSLGSCVVYLHIDNKVFPTIFEVTDTSEPIILGRKQAKAMGYIQYPAIKPPNISSSSLPLHKVCAGTTHNPKSQADIKNKHAKTDIKNRHNTTHNPKSQTDIKSKHSQKIKLNATTQEKQSRQKDEPAVIKWNKDPIKLNDKVHKLPITKDYILKEFSDVFKGIGTLPGGPYHIRLKDDYKPVQHPPKSVPITMQPAYKAELDRLTEEGIITEVHEHTEWINSIGAVMKPDGSLRLCLDPKDLNKAIERNQWYSRPIDDILPELANSNYKTLKDATSEYWHILLDLASSLMTTFSTPWGKFRWLCVPFRLKIASNVFQERLNRVLRLLEGVYGIADDILTHGTMKIEHDGRLLTLLKTARMNNLSLNPKKIQFKSTDCQFFGHQLTPEGLKCDPEKIKAIVEMKAPQSIQTLQSFNSMVNYLKRFSPVLSELSEPLCRLTKQNTVWAWESEQEETFKKSNIH